jgi:hypothetical protein
MEGVAEILKAKSARPWKPLRLWTFGVAVDLHPVKPLLVVEGEAEW